MTSILVHVPTLDISLDRTQVLGFDTETHLIAPGLVAPRMVCLSGARRVGEEMQAGVVLRPQGLEWLRSALAHPGSKLIAHNAPYDLIDAMAEDSSLVIPIFDAYRAGRIECTLIKQQVIDVALGMRKFRRVNGVVSRASYGLSDLVMLYYQRHLEKDDTWRLRYALLDGIPIEQWPAEARDYAIGDAIEALLVWEAQEREIAELWPDGLPNQAEQQQASLALALISAWGIRAEAESVERFIKTCEDAIVNMHSSIGEYEAAEIEAAERNGEVAPMRIFKPDGSRTMAAIRARVVASLEGMQVDVPRTKTGLVGTDKETLQMCTDDPVLAVLAESMSFVKHLGQWGPVLRAAVHRPVVCRYGVMMETGRSSASGSEGQEGTNIQNPPRDGDVRPCVVPRPGYVLVSTDADTIELRAHAQNMLDLGIQQVRLADTLIRQARDGGPDAHEVMASGLMSITPEEVQQLIKAGDKTAGDARQFAKIPGYGFPGGLGAEAFVAYAAGQLKKVDYLKWFHAVRAEAIAKAAGYRQTWFETFPENHEYFAIVRGMLGSNKRATITQLMSGRIRGDVRYAAICNGFFQSRVADAMKDILFELQDESYTGRCVEKHQHGSDFCTHTGRSVLFGSRFTMFLHDEPIGEHPEATVHERAGRQQNIVVTRLNKWMPDIPCGSTAVATRKWYKGAKPVYRDGKLVPSKPEKYKGADGKERTRWVEDTEPAHIIMPSAAPQVTNWAPTLQGRLAQWEAAHRRLLTDAATA